MDVRRVNPLSTQARAAQLYRMLLEVHAAVAQGGEPAAMLQKICDTAFRAEGVVAAWGALIDPRTDTLEPVAFPRMLKPFEALVRGMMNAPGASGNSPTVRAVREGLPQFVLEPRSLELPAEAQAMLGVLGIGAVAALPLSVGGRPAGVFTLYLRRAEDLDPQTQLVLRAAGESISLALQRFHDQKRLVESEAKFHALVEQSIAGIYMVDDERFAYVNPRLCEILGYSEAELLAMGPREVVLEEDRDLVLGNVRSRIAGQAQSLRYDFRVRRKDGTVRHVGVHGNAMAYGGRRVVIGLLQDISDRVLAEHTVEQQLDQLERAMVGTVGAMSAMVELRDPYTAGHERRVGSLARAIGEMLRLPAESARGLEIAGGLHDVGKISVPAEILSKPTRLSAVEFSLVKGHARSGYEILKDVDFPWPVAQATLQHHERLDGSGYPEGLKDGAIILEARILAVADVVESMSSHRPYRAALGIELALGEIEGNAGRLYDADVARACAQLFREKSYRFET
ncbi:MAG TPA: HD domain-containing phosphohydrolase [Burkholderiales bacterium]|nr:HD domain-containing phosphohydrolase [Burkholderiales bacterium]